jgi:hypothetical protein
MSTGGTMQITNVHERAIAAPAAQVGALLDTLASDNDRFWPHEDWPAVKFDGPLQVGATGGHGTGLYRIVAYTPGRHIRFEFVGDGRSGYHEFEIRPLTDGTSLLRHALKAQVPVLAIYLWHTRIRALHDAVLEDLLDKVEGRLASVAKPHAWSEKVIALRQQQGLSPARAGMAVDG